MIKASAFLVAIASSLYALTASAAAQCEGPTLDGNTWNLTCAADAGDSGDDYQCDYILVLSYAGGDPEQEEATGSVAPGSERRHHLVGRRQGRRIGYRVGEYRQRFLRTVIHDGAFLMKHNTPCLGYFRVHCRCFVGGVFEGGGAPTTRRRRSPAAIDRSATAAAAALPAPNPERNAYFGDVHVHTGWSFDAFTNGSKTTPTDAYAWAQGQGDHQQRRRRQDSDPDAARLLYGCRPRRVHGRVQSDGEPGQPAEQDGELAKGVHVARRRTCGCRRSPSCCAT